LKKIDYLKGVGFIPRGIRVKPSKPASLFGMMVGIVFVFIGLFVVIPSAGMFGVF